MPPEQSAGRPVYATDIYALGLTAIYALTGKTPQELTTDPQTGEIEWGSLASTSGTMLSPLSSVLEQAIRFHPQERFPSAALMAEALNGKGLATSSPTLVVAPASPAKPRTANLALTPKRMSNCLLKLLGLILFAVLGSAGLLYWWLFSNKPEPSLPTREVEKNPYSTVGFPQNSCGEALPDDSNSYPLAVYPVFTKFNAATLAKIKTEFCRDAFVHIDGNTNTKIIQIASFVNLKQAQQFSKFMQSILDHSEVGNPRIISVNPEQKNKEDQPETTQNRPEIAENYFNSVDFPQKSCGQALPKNSSAYPLRIYPVYVNFNSATLSSIKARFCRDAFVKTRKDTNTKVIQIASFLDPDKAQQFSKFIEIRVGSAEVETSRILNTNPLLEDVDK
jgi:serine/threonine-protein kinase